MKAKKRVFLAVDIPEQWRSILKKHQLDLKEKYSKLRITPPRNFHITITFFGFLDDPEIEKLQEDLTEIIIAVRQFLVKGSDCGHFYNMGRTVFWYGISSEELTKIAAKTNALTTEASELPYKGHVTLGRLNKQKIKDPQIMPKLSLPKFLVEKIVLYKSLNDKHGPVYKRLKDWTIK